MFYSAKTSKDGKQPHCKLCHSKRNSKHYYDNHQENRERLSKYYYDNHDREKEYRRQHYRNNKSAYLANNYLRDKRIKIATPNWLTKEMRNEIKLKYLISGRLSSIHKVEYHVDHIVPICGDKVCGLHVPWNLQVILGEENLQKSNNFEDNNE